MAVLSVEKVVKEGAPLDRRYLPAVAPLPDYILQVDFVSGARLLLDMKPYLDMENGKATPKLDTVAFFARRLEVSADAVIHDTPEDDVPFCVKQFFAGMSEEEAAGYIRLCEDAEKIRTKNR